MADRGPAPASAALPLVLVWCVATAPVARVALAEPTFTRIDALAAFSLPLLALAVAVEAPAHMAKIVVVLVVFLLIVHGMHDAPFHAVVQVALLCGWALAGGVVSLPRGAEARGRWPAWCMGVLVVATIFPLLPDVTSRFMPWLSGMVADLNARSVERRLHLAVALVAFAVVAAVVAPIRTGGAGASARRAVVAPLRAVDRQVLWLGEHLVRGVRRWNAWSVPRPDAIGIGVDRSSSHGSGEAERSHALPWWRVPVATWLAVQAAMIALAGVAGNSWRDRAQQDTSMFVEIAQVGPQWPAEGRPSVVSFPGYGLAIRWVDALVGDVVLAAVLVAAFAGLGVLLVFWRWMEAVGVSPSARRLATVGFAAFPYSFFALGVAYSDGLFAVLAIGAFLLIERDRPVWAGLVGAAATATRPTGIALLAGLVVLQGERVGLLRGVGWPPRTWGAHPIGGWRAWTGRARASTSEATARPRHGAVLLAAAGLGGYALYCWRAWGDPIAFWTAQRWYGHGTFFGASTWAKEWYLSTVLVGPWDGMSQWRWAGSLANTLFMAGLTVAAALAVPAVARRYGAGYGVFLAGVVIQTWVGATNFGAAGRYLVVVLPLFALVAEAADRRERKAWPLLVPSSGYAALLFLAFMNTPGLPSW